MSWTQPICDPCWKINEGDREPARLLPHARTIETCCACGRDTLSGIYFRKDPKLVAFPARDDVDDAQDVIERVLGGKRDA